MIQFIVLQNRQGKTRLSKYYRAYTDEEKTKIEGEIHRIVTTRDPKFTNFVEVCAPHAAEHVPCGEWDLLARLLGTAVPGTP
jgi:citrate synthase